MEELKPEKESRTAIITDTDIQSEDFIVEEEKKETAKSVLFSNNSPDTYFERLRSTSALSTSMPTTKTKIQLEATQSFFNDSIVETMPEEPEIETSKLVELEEPVVETMPEKEIKNEEKLKEETLPLRRSTVKPGLKSRIKVIVFGFCAIMVCLMGWSIYNAVQIKTLTAETQMANKTYSVNVSKYISELAKTDDLTNEESIFNLDKLAEADIIPLTPKAVENPVSYSVNSNWFNRLCNWLSNIFK